MKHRLIEQLTQIIGKANVLVDGDLSAYELDWRKRSRGKALAVARPANTQEVAAIVKACAASGVSIVTQGGNTGLVGGSIPDESGQQVVLSLQRMNSVRGIDAANLTMTVDAGCILQTVQDAAENAGFLFPLSLAAEGSCTVGGNLATNAGGTQVVRYGNARDLCLGLEVVTAQGDIWQGLSGLRKDNTGYDLRDLFVGSEGTLGIITAATLKLYPMPAARLTAWAAVPSMQHAVTIASYVTEHSCRSGTVSGLESTAVTSNNRIARDLDASRLRDSVSRRVHAVDSVLCTRDPHFCYQLRSNCLVMPITTRELNGVATSPDNCAVATEFLNGLDTATNASHDAEFGCLSGTDSGLDYKHGD